MRISPTGRIILSLSATVALTASFIGISPVTATEGSYPKTSAAAQQAIEASLDAGGATSISAAFTDTNGTLWQGTVGEIDANGASPTSDTRYGIGSTSKMFATAAVMQLVDAGLVDLDKPVVRYLPAFSMQSPQYRQITVRMLLDHSAGFPGSAYANAFTTKPYTGYASDVLKYLARSSLKTTPGAMSVYCNDCFTVAGELVAAVSGIPFTTYVDKNLLAPINMSESQYVTGEMPAPGTVARVVIDGRTQPQEVTNVYASGGLISTPDNMMSFARMIMNGGMSGQASVLSSESISEMGRSQMETTLDPVPDAQWHYGLGWDSVRDLSLRAVGVRAWVKGGDTSDYHSSLIVAPEAGLAVYVAGAGTYGSGIAQAVGEEILLNALVERGDIPAMPQKIGTEQPPTATPTRAQIDAMLGTFLGTPSLAYRISEGNRGVLDYEVFANGAWIPGRSTISFREDGKWWIDAQSSTSMSTVKGWGRTYLVFTSPNGYGNAFAQEIIGQRISPAAPIARAWRDRLGEWLYVSDLPSSTIWFGAPATTISRIPGLPGYVNLNGLSAVDARQPEIGSMFLQVPLMQGRDLDDAVPTSATQIRMGTAVMVSRNSLPSLRATTTKVRIGADGYGEWRKANRARVVKVRGAEAWFVYDTSVSLLAHGTRSGVDVRIPTGGLLLVLSSAGDVVKVKDQRSSTQ